VPAFADIGCHVFSTKDPYGYILGFLDSMMLTILLIIIITITLLPESTSELYPLSDCRLSAKLVPALADIGCLVFSVTDPYVHIIGFLDRRC
jgi:hypothetical protein